MKLDSLSITLLLCLGMSSLLSILIRILVRHNLLSTLINHSSWNTLKLLTRRSHMLHHMLVLLIHMSVRLTRMLHPITMHHLLANSHHLLLLLLLLLCTLLRLRLQDLPGLLFLRHVSTRSHHWLSRILLLHRIILSLNGTLINRPLGLSMTSNCPLLYV